MTNKRPYIVVAGIDFESDGDVALATALRIAAGAGDSEVHVLHVEGSLDKFSGGAHDSRVQEVMQSIEKVSQAQVEQLLAEQPQARISRVVTHCGGGDPARQLVQLAASLDAELVVVGSRGRRGLKRLLLGSVAERVTRLAGCTVLVARPRNHAVDHEEVTIEPPCPQCLETRAKSDGKELWCPRHANAKYHPVAHRFYAGGPSFGAGSRSARPFRSHTR